MPQERAKRRLAGHATHEVIAQLAGVQRGVVARHQLLDHGVGPGAIAHALSTRRLHIVLPRIYGALPVSALPPLAREQAAILAHEPDAYLSHASAAMLWGLDKRPSREVDITVVGRHAGRAGHGVRIHFATALDRRDTRMRAGLPVTAPARTILDLAPSLATRQLEQIFDEALHARLMRRTEVRAMLERHPRRPGSVRVAALAHEDRTTAWTRGDTERRLLELLRKARLPVPEVNTSYGPFELDFFWPAQRLAVETDGYEFHSSRRDLERDHQRDLELQAAGVMIVRFSWRQVRDEPELVIAQLAGLLAMRRAA